MKTQKEVICNIAFGCACKKPQAEKRVIIQTLTTSQNPLNPEITKWVESWCKLCGYKIYPKAPKPKNAIREKE